MQYIYKNQHEFLERRRRLRRRQTKAEAVLWQELRAHKTGHKFYRQFSFEKKFIADLYCEEFKLIIELDGPIHDIRQAYDRSRQQWFEARGFTVIRFKNDEVLFAREKVLVRIASFLTTLPRPLLKREGDTSPTLRAYPPLLREGQGEFPNASI